VDLNNSTYVDRKAASLLMLGYSRLM